MIGRAGGVLCGAVGSAVDSWPVWLVTEVKRFGGVASGEVGSSGDTEPVCIDASHTGGSSRTTRDITWSVEPDRLRSCFARGACPPPVVD